MSSEEAYQFSQRLKKHIAGLVRVVDDLKFEIELLEDFGTNDADWMNPDRLDRTAQIITEACGDGRDILDYLENIANGRPSGSPLDPE